MPRWAAGVTGGAPGGVSGGALEVVSLMPDDGADAELNDGLAVGWQRSLMRRH